MSHEVQVSRRRGERIISVHTHAHRRIIKIADKLHDMPIRRWFAFYGSALAKEVHRKERMTRKLRTYTEQRTAWRRRE